MRQRRFLSLSGTLNKFQRRFGYLRIVPKSREPVNAGFVSEPSELPLCKLTSSLLDFFHRRRERYISVQMSTQLRVTDKLKRFRIWRHARQYESVHFIKPAIANH